MKNKMNDRKKCAWTTGIISVLVTTAIVLSFFGGLFGGIGIVKAQGTPIRIDNNWELWLYSDSGSGTVDDPYVFADKVINGWGYGFCIYIGNTTKHWEISHCDLYGANNVGTAYAPDCNIALYNVKGGNITNNTIYTAYQHGITLTGPHLTHPGSDNINITENTIHDNYEYGLFLDADSDNCTIWHNNFIGNGDGNPGTIQATDHCGDNNTWHMGYSWPNFDPTTEAGNYWDDHDILDTKRGPNQNLGGGTDDIVDLGGQQGGLNPYFIDGYPPEEDTYPFEFPNGWY